MNYTDAMAAAKEGKKLSRRGWGYFGWYHVTYYTNGTEEFFSMNDPCNGMPTVVRQWKYEPTKADLDATDWEVIEEIRKWR